MWAPSPPPRLLPPVCPCLPEPLSHQNCAPLDATRHPVCVSPSHLNEIQASWCIVTTGPTISFSPLSPPFSPSPPHPHITNTTHIPTSPTPSPPSPPYHHPAPPHSTPPHHLLLPPKRTNSRCSLVLPHNVQLLCSPPKSASVLTSRPPTPHGLGVGRSTSAQTAKSLMTS